MAACPYMGRWFNFADPVIPSDKINTVTHYLGNRPRMRNVVEKCTFCIQKVRAGMYPACVEVCPVDNCITMVRQTEGTDPRTGRKINPDYANWTTHPNNPMAKVAAE